MKVKEITKPKKERVEYFSDEMAKEIYVFQDTYKAPKGGKPIIKSVSLSIRKK